jgi:O-antigen ligase
MIDLAPAGGSLACLGLALLFAARGRDARVAGFGLAVVGGCLLAAALAPSSGNPLVLVGAGVVAVALSLLVAHGLGRWPWALAFATLACVPVRVPVHVDGTSHKLLVPLYVVAGGAAVRILLDTLGGDTRSRELGPLAVPLAAFVLWTGLSLTWGEDVSAGALELFAFYLPFGILALAFARLDWNRRALSWLFAQLLAMALAFAIVGIWQHQTKLVFWNPKVIVPNAYAPFYRVNSVFWDPSIYGRFLVVAILAAVVLVVRGRPSPRLAWGATAAVVVLWVGLFFSYSQTSFASLVVALILVALVAWGRRAGPAVALVVLIALAIAVASPRVRHSLLHGQGNAATGGRASLVTGGLRIARRNPVLGVGVGGFKSAYSAQHHLKGRQTRKAASHDTPVTVAAEEGLPGLALYAWLVLAALAAAFRRLGRRFDTRAALTFGVLFAAILVHSFAYADFFEDPTTWALLGLVALAARVLEERAARLPAEAVEPVPEPALRVPAQ